MRIKKNIIEKLGEIRETIEKGLIMSWIRVGNKKWKSIGLYVKENLERRLEKLKK